MPGLSDAAQFIPQVLQSNMKEVVYCAALLLFLVIAGVFISERSRMKKMAATLGLNGISFSVELHELVKKEVARVSLASLGRLARVDRELIDFWERGRLLSPEDSARRIGLIESQVTEVEKKLRSAPIEDRYQLALQLRDLYWKWLEYGRQHFASSEGYQTIRGKVIAGLKEIEQIGEAGNAS